MPNHPSRLHFPQTSYCERTAHTQSRHTVTHKNEKTAPGTFITGWYYRGAGPNVPQLIFFSGRIIFCVPSWVIHTHNSRFIRVSHNVVHCKSTPYATKSSRLRAKLARVPRSNAAAGEKTYCVWWNILQHNLIYLKVQSKIVVGKNRERETPRRETGVQKMCWHFYMRILRISYICNYVIIFWICIFIFCWLSFNFPWI